MTTRGAATILVRLDLPAILSTAASAGFFVAFVLFLLLGEDQAFGLGWLFSVILVASYAAALPGSAPAGPRTRWVLAAFNLAVAALGLYLVVVELPRQQELSKLVPIGLSTMCTWVLAITAPLLVVRPRHGMPEEPASRAGRGTTGD